MKTSLKNPLSLTIVVFIILVLGICYVYVKNTYLQPDRESTYLLADIQENGLQKFLDNHTVAQDTILSKKVGPFIESGQEEWLKVASDMYYGRVIVQDTRFGERVGLHITNALDVNPTVVFRALQNSPQILYTRSPKDPFLVLESATTTAVDVVKEICNNTNHDFDTSSGPASAVYAAMARELEARKRSVEQVTEVDILDLKTACISNIDAILKIIADIQKKK